MDPKTTDVAYATLAKAYCEEMTAMVEKFPAQAGNVRSYVAWLAGARVGRTTRRIMTKGEYTDIPAGSVVLWSADRSDGVGRATIYRPRFDMGFVHTVVDVGDIEAL